MEEFFFKLFMIVGGLLLVVLFALVIRDAYLTETLGPRYYCDEYEKFQTCSTTIQPIYTVDSKGNVSTTFMPVTNCEYRCLRSHKNPKRADD